MTLPPPIGDRAVFASSLTNKAIIIVSDFQILRQGEKGEAEEPEELTVSEEQLGKISDTRV